MNNTQLLHFTDEAGNRKPICAAFYHKVDAAKRISELVALYKKEPSWALSVHYPSFEIMKERFDNSETRRCGVYVDHDVGTICDDQIYIFNKCRGKAVVKFDPMKACFPVLYMGLGCDMNIHVDGTYCEINIYDGGRLNITTARKGKVVVYKYADANIVFTDPERVIIRDKR